MSLTRFQVKILGSDEIHVKEGSDVSLRCAITNTAQVIFCAPILKWFFIKSADKFACAITNTAQVVFFSSYCKMVFTILQVCLCHHIHSVGAPVMDHSHIASTLLS